MVLKSSAMQSSEGLDTKHFWPENSSYIKKTEKKKCGQFQNLCELGTYIKVKNRFLETQYHW